jgi:hypothetical protein
VRRPDTVICRSVGAALWVGVEASIFRAASPPAPTLTARRGRY